MTLTMIMPSATATAHPSESYGMKEASRPRTRRVPAMRPIPSGSRDDHGPREDNRPISLLDDAHRRMNKGVQTITDRLRLQSTRVDPPTTKAVLMAMQHRLQATAALHKARCREGNFDQIDLAVYLGRIASLMNAPAHPSLPGGWALDPPGQTLTWADEPRNIHEASAGGLLDLEAALQSLPPGWREIARRAVCACAVLFPPSIFRWRSPEPQVAHGGGEQPAGPGEVSIRLRTTDDCMAVELSLSDRGPGLPKDGDLKQRRSFGLDLVLVLARQLHDSLTIGPGKRVVFGVTFIPACTETREQASRAS